MFYKYYSVNDYSEKVLETGDVWTSSPKEFNDPFDSLVTLNFNKVGIKELFVEWASEKSICCFSRNFRNILMWSHYADNHRGFCIGIDNPEIEDSDIFSNVVYSQSFLEFDDEEKFLKHSSGRINKNWRKILTHKSLDWSYEEEVRLILELGDSCSMGKTFNIGKESITKVFFGLCMSENDKILIKNIMKERRCDFYQMELSNSSFSLEAKIL